MFVGERKKNRLAEIHNFSRRFFGLPPLTESLDQVLQRQPSNLSSLGAIKEDKQRGVRIGESTKSSMSMLKKL